jgi:hypothetical protein
MDLALQRGRRVGGLLDRPQRVHEHLGRDGVSGPGQQDPEQRALPLARQRYEGTRRRADLDRAEHPELHGHRLPSLLLARDSTVEVGA